MNAFRCKPTTILWFKIAQGVYKRRLSEANGLVMMLEYSNIKISSSQPIGTNDVKGGLMAMWNSGYECISYKRICLGVIRQEL